MEFDLEHIDPLDKYSHVHRHFSSVQKVFDLIGMQFPSASIHVLDINVTSLLNQAKRALLNNSATLPEGAFLSQLESGQLSKHGIWIFLLSLRPSDLKLLRTQLEEQLERKLLHRQITSLQELINEMKSERSSSAAGTDEKSKFQSKRGRKEFSHHHRSLSLSANFSPSDSFPQYCLHYEKFLDSLFDLTLELPAIQNWPKSQLEEKFYCIEPNQANYLFEVLFYSLWNWIENENRIESVDFVNQRISHQLNRLERDSAALKQKISEATRKPRTNLGNRSQIIFAVGFSTAMPSSVFLPVNVQ